LAYQQQTTRADVRFWEILRGLLMPQISAYLLHANCVADTGQKNV